MQHLVDYLLIITYNKIKGENTLAVAVKIDKSLLESFSGEVDTSVLTDAFYNLSDIIDDITTELSYKFNFIKINNIDVVMAGDFATKTSIPDSDLDIILAIKSSQLEINTIKEYSRFSKKFLTKLSLAWNSVRSRKRGFLLRKKKKKQKLEDEKYYNLDINKNYTIVDLQEEYFNQLPYFFSNTTVIYNNLSQITLLAKEEIGFKINIKLAFVHDDEYKLWTPNSNKFTSLYLFDAIESLQKKNDEINQINYSQNPDSKKNQDLFYKSIRVLKNLALIYTQNTKLGYIDSLVFNCPNQIFSDDVYSTTIRLINHLKTAHIADFYSVFNQNENLYSYHNISILKIKEILNNITSMLN